MDTLSHEPGPMPPELLEAEITSQVNVGLWCSMGAMALAMVGPFTCYMSYLAAFPLAVFGAWTGYKLNTTASMVPEARTARTAAAVSMVAGIITSLMSGMLLLIMAMILLLYAGMFVLAMLGAALG